MIRKTISIFAAVVFVYVVMLHPQMLVDVVQAFINGAHRVAVAIGDLNPRV